MMILTHILLFAIRVQCVLVIVCYSIYSTTLMFKGQKKKYLYIAKSTLEIHIQNLIEAPGHFQVQLDHGFEALEPPS